MSTNPDRPQERLLGGDRATFGAEMARHRRELQVHCYRMLGSFEDAEDAVQETLLRAWRRRETYAGRASVRAWLYGIATNTCLDLLEKRSRRLLPPDVVGPADPTARPAPASETGWIEPYPDRLLDEICGDADDPHRVIVARETIELAFLVAIQHLPPRQRAVLILRDVLSWSAQETAAMLDMTVIAANSALQRGRETLRDRLPRERTAWATGEPDPREREVLERYVDAWNRMDPNGLAALLAADARVAMPPTPSWYLGREAIRAFLEQGPMSSTAERHVHVPVRANRQPAFAIYLAGADGLGSPRPLGISVLRIERGAIAEIDAFLNPALVPRFIPVPAG